MKKQRRSMTTGGLSLRSSSSSSSSLLLGALLFSSLFFLFSHGFEFGLEDPIYIDKSEVSVSGFSGGGFFAVQFQVAYSSVVSGVGVFGGGPYYCAEGSLTQSQTTCKTGTPDITNLISDTKRFADDGLIDPLQNLTNTQVYLYSGLNDTVVLPSVTGSIKNFYETWTTSFTSVFDLRTPHCIPTINGTTPCNSTTAPFLNNCGYDGMGAMLQAVSSSELISPPTTAAANLSNLWRFSQVPFDPLPSNGGNSTAVLSEFGYYYLPTSCANNNTKPGCRLHIFFHGEDQSGPDFPNLVSNLTLNAWAEVNNILVIYPQAATVFDWWGFTNSDYPLKYGLHIRAVVNILNNITNVDLQWW